MNVVSMTCLLVHENHRNNSHSARSRQFRKWRHPKIIDMCQQVDWQYLLSDSAKSSRRHRLGLGWYECINGVVLVVEFTQPSQRSVFELYAPTKSGMSIPRLFASLMDLTLTFMLSSTTSLVGYSPGKYPEPLTPISLPSFYWRPQMVFSTSSPLFWRMVESRISIVLSMNLSAQDFCDDFLLKPIFRTPTRSSNPGGGLSNTSGCS